MMLVMMALGASDANHDGVLTMMVGMLLMISTCKTWSALSLEGGGMSGAPCLLSQHLGNVYGDGDDNDDHDGGGDDNDGDDVDDGDVGETSSSTGLDRLPGKDLR